jgi:hypothetical protein
MRSIRLAHLAAALLVPAFLQAGEYTTFDCPGATSTTAASINTAGQIVGSCTVDGVIIGFLRQPNGVFETFTVDKATSTNAIDINDNGEIVGVHYNASGRLQGFLVNDGAVTTFMAPYAMQTVPVGINSSGTVAGYYIDAGNINHGFTRDSLGNFTNIDIPNLTGLVMTGINDSGELVGYGLINSRTKGFTVNSAGLDIFYVGGSTATMPMAINADGGTTGSFFSGNGGSVINGFVRSRFDTITIFRGEGNHIYPLSINVDGEVAGYVATLQGYHGFTQLSGEYPFYFDDPAAGTSESYGTVAVKINSLRRVTGYYYDSTGQVHGFVRNVLPPN